MKKFIGGVPVESCGCRGPQNGEPVCPCMMRDVRIVDGRYVRITDLGPAPMTSGLSSLTTKLAAPDAARQPRPSSRHDFIFGDGC